MPIKTKTFYKESISDLELKKAYMVPVHKKIRSIVLNLIQILNDSVQPVQRNLIKELGLNRAIIAIKNNKDDLDRIGALFINKITNIDKEIRRMKIILEKIG